MQAAPPQQPNVQPAYVYPQMGTPQAQVQVDLRIHSSSYVFINKQKIDVTSETEMNSILVR